jgi:dipeptidase
VNEHGLGFAESTCAAKTVGFSPLHGGANLLCIEELTKIALERCMSARCAVATMGALAEQYGYFSTEAGTPAAYSLGGSAECLLVSDADEVWQFHVMTAPGGTGALWAAQRVPDEHATALPNSFVIRELALEDADNYLAAAGVVDAAAAAGWYDPASPAPFDFTAAFAYFNATEMHLGPGCPEEYNLYTGRRMWRVFDRLAPSLALDPTLGFVARRRTYPFSVQPDALASLGTVKALLRDHYEGTLFDLTRGAAAGAFGNPDRWAGGANERAVQGGWERAISMHRTTWTFIVESRRAGDAVPPPAATRVWFGYDSPHATVLAPLYAAQATPPPSWTWARQCTLSRGSAFWAANFIKNWVELRYSVMMPDVRAAQASLEAQLEAAADEAEGAAAALLAAVGGGAAAVEASRVALEQFALSAAEDVTRRWWTLADALVAKFSNGYVCLPDGEGDRAAPGYPAAWLRAVGYDAYPATHEPAAGAAAAPCASGAVACAVAGALRSAAGWLAGAPAHQLTLASDAGRRAGPAAVA